MTCTDPGHHDHTCPGYAAERQADALVRIADTLDDYMDLTLGAQRLAQIARTPNPDASSLNDLFSELDATLGAIADRRRDRTRAP